jgi:hypothetical protein
VVLVTVATLGLFLREFPDMVVPAAVGSLGAVLLAATLRLANGRNRSVTGLGAGLLVIPAAVAFTGGVLIAVLVLVEQVFPVEEEALLSVGWLLILGHTGVVVGCSLAALGLALSGSPVATRDGLNRAMRVIVVSGAVPIATAFAFLAIAARTGTTADAALVAPLADLVAPVVALVGVVVPGRFLVPVCLAGLVVVSALAVGRFQQGSDGGLLAPDPRIAGSIAGGVVATIAAVAVAEWAYRRVAEELLRRFPEEIEGRLEEATTTTASSFGESTAVLVALVLCLGLVAGLLALLYLGLVAGTLSDKSGSASLAATGVFLAALFGGTVGAPAWLVVAGVAASMLVWDAGRFGVSLASEVGSGRTRRVEFVHLGGAILVGIAAVAVSLVVVGRLPADASAVPAGTDLLALCSVVVGLLSLVLALR